MMFSRGLEPGAVCQWHTIRAPFSPAGSVGAICMPPACRTRSGSEDHCPARVGCFVFSLRLFTRGISPLIDDALLRLGSAYYAPRIGSFVFPLRLFTREERLFLDVAISRLGSRLSLARLGSFVFPLRLFTRGISPLTDAVVSRIGSGHCPALEPLEGLGVA